MNRVHILPVLLLAMGTTVVSAQRVIHYTTTEQRLRVESKSALAAKAEGRVVATAQNGPIPDIEKEVAEDAVWSWRMPWYLFH